VRLVQRIGRDTGGIYASALTATSVQSGDHLGRLLVRGKADPGGEPISLGPLRLAMEERHRILLRDCRSFAGLDDTWLRIALSDGKGRRRLLGALAKELNPPAR
jgi:hypothetical protein